MHNDPFTINLPHLNLHGETYETMGYLLSSFIKDNYIIVDNGEPGKEKVSFPSNINYDIEEIHQKIQEMLPNALIIKICTL